MVEDALRGDEPALAALVQTLRPVIQARTHRIMARRESSDADCKDMVQEVWVALLQNDGEVLRKFDPRRGASLRRYVGMITTREVGNRLRGRASQRRGGREFHVGVGRVAELTDRAEQPENEVVARELLEKLVEHLGNVLPRRGQLVFRYAFAERLSPQDVAGLLEIDVQVVYNWRHKIRRHASAFLMEARERRADSELVG
ncbi:MAG: sigma-70 family RNA polymerase sigma factor [Myxococcota bacterium]